MILPFFKKKKEEKLYVPSLEEMGIESVNELIKDITLDYIDNKVLLELIVRNICAFGANVEEITERTSFVELTIHLHSVDNNHIVELMEILSSHSLISAIYPENKYIKVYTVIYELKCIKNNLEQQDKLCFKPLIHYIKGLSDSIKNNVCGEYTTEKIYKAYDINDEGLIKVFNSFEIKSHENTYLACKFNNVAIFDIYKSLFDNNPKIISHKDMITIINTDELIGMIKELKHVSELVLALYNDADMIVEKSILTNKEEEEDNDDNIQEETQES